MTAAALIKKMEKKGFVMVPRDEYDELRARAIPIDDEPMTASERRALIQARKELKAGRTMSLDELSRKLGFRNKK